MMDRHRAAGQTHGPFGGFLTYIWLFCGLFILYLLLSPYVRLDGTSAAYYPAFLPYEGDALVRFFMAVSLLLALLVAIYWALGHRLTFQRGVFLLLFAGILLRFGYMLYTPFFVRGHDVSTLDGYGHLAYIYRLFAGEGLADTSAGQYYHPPLDHLAAALTARLFAFLTGETKLDTIFEACRLVPCFASSALLILSYRLFQALGFSKRAVLLAVSIVAFHPTFVLLAASINNDMLMVFFFMAAFLYTVRWYGAPTYRNILIIAVLIGCAMMTKLSGALIAFYTGFVFLLVLAQHLRTRSALPLFGQFAAFSAVCFPLGLWYPLRNLRLFGQPLGYVAPISVTSQLYVGDRPPSERFLTFSLRQMLQTPFCDPFSDTRLWEYAVRCALFGEFVFPARHEPVARSLIVFSLALIVISLGAMLYFLFFARREEQFAVRSFAAVWVILIASYIFFNIQYPFGCTMDFRYIVPTVITGAAFLGLLLERLRGGGLKTAGAVALCSVSGAFCLLSAVFFII
ncbi:phospholipid carrier-dependent glycosyltransferase [Oscillospiraceae bacterium CM]|nr:phospholipid carrier-dependent glycosyltransferase [Oscillospiraceae bacterium CM]